MGADRVDTCQWCNSGRKCYHKETSWQVATRASLPRSGKQKSYGGDEQDKVGRLGLNLWFDAMKKK